MKKSLLLIVLALFVCFGLHAQSTHTVTGKVLDADGSPVSTALVKYGEMQVFVNDDGTFQIEVPDSVKVIEVTNNDEVKKVPVEGNQDNLQITMSGNQVGEVIVTGYGNYSKENYVGSANTISEKKLEKMPVTSVSKAIEGAAPGVQVTNGGGQPGSDAAIRIRGFSSISASSTPLYVVDGAPFGGDINSINPNDIANVTLLKDATATSLYGSRGANGVIVITTKRGSAGKTKITVDAKVGMVNRGIPNYDIIKNESDYYPVAWDAYRNFLIASGYSNSEAKQIASGINTQGEDNLIQKLGGYNSYNVADDQLIDTFGHLNPNATLKYHDNWDDELQRVGFRQDYTVAASGGSDKTDFYFSLGYLKEDGYIKYSDYDRITGRLNLNTQVNTWLKMGVNSSIALDNQNFLSSDNSPGYNPFLVSRTLAPIYPVYYRDSNNNKQIDPVMGGYKYDWGGYSSDPSSSIGDRAAAANTNVLGSMAYDVNNSKYTTFVASPYVEVSFLKDFKFRTMMNFNTFEGLGVSYYNPVHGQFAQQNGSVSRSEIRSYTYTWNQTLSYKKDIGDKNHLDAFVAHENYKVFQSTLAASRTGLPSLGNTNLNGAAKPVGSGSQDDIATIESYLANVSYNYDYTYYLTANVRRDGDSRFYKKWGTFGSVGAAYVISNAEFLKNIRQIDNLKIKASFGTQGNDAINSLYAWQALYDLNYPNGDYPGAIVSSIENDNLTWENQRQWNVGIEGSLFDHRLSFEVDYFDKANVDLLYYRPYPGSTGLNGRYENTLTAANRGIEFNLDAGIIRSKKADGFNWDVNLNLTSFKNLITKMPDGIDSLISGDYKWKAGHSRYEFWIAQYTGVDKATGDALYRYYDDEGNARDTFDYSYAIANGGRDYLGSPIPKLSGALTNNFSYKRFNLSFMLTFALGGKYLDDIYRSLTSASGFGSNFSTDVLSQRWSYENPDGTLPRLESESLNLGQTSSLYLIDGSFLNIRNINLSYDLPEKWFSKAHISMLRLYVAADNVYLLSKRQGMDPQANYSGVSSTATYNAARTIMFGVKLGL